MAFVLAAEILFKFQTQKTRYVMHLVMFSTCQLYPLCFIEVLCIILIQFCVSYLIETQLSAYTVGWSATTTRHFGFQNKIHNKKF